MICAPDGSRKEETPLALAPAVHSVGFANPTLWTAGASASEALYTTAGNRAQN
ncbi:MAG: hypothetical protein MUE85_22250 [Microscillaceae bacterium]|jgi:hypothetical protein|nr:hypothetical protein [Microscillaceae bacterium]